jgi:hypothetical protein
MQAAGNVGFGIGLGIIIFVWVVVGIGSLVMLVVALVDIVKRPDWEWKLAGQEKILWILLVVLINFLAIPSLIYWFNIRKKLIAVREAAQRGAYGPGHMTYAGWEPGFGPASYATTPPAGWYPDTTTPGQFRWWDGTQWMAHTWREPAPTPDQTTPT